MKTIARRLLAPLVAALLVAGAAAAQTPTLASRLVGHWSLVSVAIGDQKTYGADPKGSMFFDAAGHYAVIVVAATAPAAPARSPISANIRSTKRRASCRCTSTPATAPARRARRKAARAARRRRADLAQRPRVERPGRGDAGVEARRLAGRRDPPSTGAAVQNDSAISAPISLWTALRASVDAVDPVK